MAELFAAGVPPGARGLAASAWMRVRTRAAIASSLFAFVTFCRLSASFSSMTRCTAVRNSRLLAVTVASVSALLSASPFRVAGNVEAPKTPPLAFGADAGSTPGCGAAVSRAPLATGALGAVALT